MVNNEANKDGEYRRKVFHYLKNLKDLDGEDKSADDSEPPTTIDTPEHKLERKLKRKARRLESPRKKQNTGPKNPLMQLNELKPGLQYVVESVSGPPHQPKFVVNVEVNDQKFCGTGNSKQAAKHSAAEAALASIVSPDVMASLNNSNQMDFTTDDGFTNQFVTHRNGKAEGPVTPSGRPLSKVLVDADKKNPVMLLNEIHPMLEYAVTENASSSLPSTRFCAFVSVNDKKFEGCGQSKKHARAAAARNVLGLLYNVSYTPLLMASVKSERTDLFDFPQAVADLMARSLMSTFSDVMAGDAEHSKWKVLAGIVMTRGEDMQDMQVVGLATGTKCINGEYITMTGSSLNDCHAEVVCRRCLQDLLYTHLELYLEGEGDQSILERRPHGPGFRLRRDVRFHLFISSAPCGDSRIFCPQEHEEGAGGDRHPNRNSRGVLRTKIESGEGTIPVREDQAVQTWDGIVAGQQRLLTMSCSDKIAYWNVVGLQGALLSYFMEPVYLSSVILGSLFHPDHLQRALFGRLQSTLAPLPAGYRLNKPQMTQLTTPYSRDVAKSTAFAVNWTSGLGRAEVVSAASGKTDGASQQQSRLSKRSFFQRFVNIHDRLPHVDQFEAPPAGLYGDYKAAVHDYQRAKRVVYKAFAAAGLGRWVKKPAELNGFELASF